MSSKCRCGPGRLAGRTDECDRLTECHRLTGAHEQLTAVTVERCIAARMTELDIVAVPLALPGGEHRAVSKGTDRRAGIGREVCAVVKFDLVFQRVQPVAEAGRGVARDRRGPCGKRQLADRVADVRRDGIAGIDRPGASRNASRAAKAACSSGLCVGSGVGSGVGSKVGCGVGAGVGSGAASPMRTYPPPADTAAAAHPVPPPKRSKTRCGSRRIRRGNRRPCRWPERAPRAHPQPPAGAIIFTAVSSRNTAAQP